MPNEQISINMVELEGDEFANFVLYQQPVEEPQEVSSVSVDKPRKNGGKRGGKLSYTQMMMLGLLTFCCLMGPAAATPVQAAIQVSASIGISFFRPSYSSVLCLGQVQVSRIDRPNQCMQLTNL